MKLRLIRFLIHFKSIEVQNPHPLRLHLNFRNGLALVYGGFLLLEGAFENALTLKQLLMPEFVASVKPRFKIFKIFHSEMSPGFEIVEKCAVLFLKNTEKVITRINHLCRIVFGTELVVIHHLIKML